jgi:hypothetical protein
LPGRAIESPQACPAAPLAPAHVIPRVSLYESGKGSGGIDEGPTLPLNLSHGLPMGRADRGQRARASIAGTAVMRHLSRFAATRDRERAGGQVQG